MTDFTNVPEQSLFQATLRGGIDSSQTTGIVISQQIESFQGLTRITILNPVAGAEILGCTGQNISGELTGVARGLPSYDGGPSTAKVHPSGVKVVLSNPFQVYQDIATAVNSKLNSDRGVVTTFIELPSYANATARDVAIPAPNANTLVALEDLNGGERGFSLFNGVDWVDIDAPTNFPIFTGAVEFPSYADATARDTAIPAPLANQIVVLENLNGGNGGLSYYNGVSWRDIDAPTAAPNFTVRIGVPRYANNAARDIALPTPSLGQLIFNDTSDTLEIYTSSGWEPLDLGTVTPLASTADAGRVRLATPTQVFDGDATGGGQPLTVTPATLQDTDVSSHIPATGKLAKFGPNNEINVPMGTNLTVSSLAVGVGQLLSLNGRKDGVEPTMLWHLQDGAKHSVAHGMSSPQSIEMTEWTGLLVDVSGGVIRARLVSVDENYEQVLGAISTSAIVATSIFALINIGENKVGVISVDTGTYNLSVISWNGATFNFGATEALPTQNIDNIDRIDFCSPENNKIVCFYKGSTASTAVATAFSVNAGINDVTLTVGVPFTVRANYTNSSCRCLEINSTKIATYCGISGPNLAFNRLNLSTLTLTSEADETTGTASLASAFPYGVKSNDTFALPISNVNLPVFHCGAGNASGRKMFSASLVTGGQQGSSNWVQKKPHGYFYGISGGNYTVYPVNLNTDFTTLFTQSRDGFQITTSSDLAQTLSLGGVTPRSHAILSQISFNSNGLKVIAVQGANVELWMHYGNFRSVVGVATEDKNITETVFVQDKGVLPLAGLTAGSMYYWDKTGELTADSALATHSLGIAVSISSLNLEIRKMRNIVPCGKENATRQILLATSDDWGAIQEASETSNSIYNKRGFTSTDRTVLATDNFGLRVSGNLTTVFPTGSGDRVVTQTG